MKSMRRLSVVLSVLLLLLAAVVVAINAFDEPLDTKAAAMGEPRPSGVPEAHNGYLALIAMGADDGADSAAYARAWLAEARAAAQENRAHKSIEAKRAQRPALCDAAQASCLAAAQDAVAVRAALAAYAEDLDRYEKLIAFGTFGAFEEILDYPYRLDAQIPPYAFTGTAQRAYHMRAALAVQAGKIDEALSDIERDIAFQRVMLGGARTLVGKMVATANYVRALAFVTDLLQTSNADMKPLAPRLTEMLKPIAPAALRMDALLESEFGLMKQAFGNPAAVDRWYEKLGMRLFYKPNATINKVYENYMKAITYLRSPPAVLLRDAPLPTADDALNFRDYFDNPMGKVLLRAGMPSFGAYALRLHDLDALNRLLGMGAEIIAADVGAEGVADFVATSDARFQDPYTGKPMAWDAASKQLSFKASAAMAKRKLFNMDNGRVFLRM